MSYYNLKLKANQPYHFDTPGRLLLVDSTGAASGVDVQLVRNGSPGVVMPERKQAFRLVADYEGVILKTAVDASVALFLGFDNVNLGLTDDSAVRIPEGVKLTNGDADAVPIRPQTGQRLPVDIGAGTVTVTADNVGVNNTDANAVPTRRQALSTFAHLAPVVVGLAAVSLGLADPTRRKLIIRNDHASAQIALGGAGVTLANGAIRLLPGDMWEETDAAGAAWYAISDTAGTNVQVMGIS